MIPQVPVTATNMPEWVRRVATTLNALIAAGEPEPVVVAPAQSAAISDVSPAPMGGTAGAPEYIAATALGGQRVVYIDGAGQARYADKDQANAWLTAGVTMAAAAAGETVRVRLAGELVEATWNWGVDSVWLGNNGLLTQTPPQTGTVVRIGTATGPNRLSIAPEVIAVN